MFHEHEHDALVRGLGEGRVERRVVRMKETIDAVQDVSSVLQGVWIEYRCQQRLNTQVRVWDWPR